MVCAPRSRAATSANPKKGRNATWADARAASGSSDSIALREEKPMAPMEEKPCKEEMPSSEEGWDTARGSEVQEMKGEVTGRGDRVVQVMKWGLVPSFAPRSDRPDHFKMVLEPHLRSSLQLVRGTPRPG